MRGDSDSQGEILGASGGDAAALERAKQLVGTIVSDRYRIHNVLAMGGMGAVFTGEHVHMRKRVAIKLLHPDTEGLPGLVARFEREAIVGAHVEHPNVAAARDFGRLPDGSYYLVLEFVRGVTLHQLIHQGPMPPGRAVRIAKEIAAGLAAIHARGIVHRDVKPRNVMVVPGATEKVKLIDFGFAKVPVEKFAAMSFQQGAPVAPSVITADGMVFGTIGYLAPEAALGMSSVDIRSDLYALGAVFYEMLAGVPPFVADGPGALFLKHRADPVPPICERVPGLSVPAQVEAIAIRLLAKSAVARYESADDVLRALDEAAGSVGPESRSGASAGHDLPMTVAGAMPPTSQPRFEDVSEGTPEPSVADHAPAPNEPPRSRRSVPVVPSSPPRKKRSLVPLLSITIAIAAIGLGLAQLRSGSSPDAAAPRPADSSAARVASVVATNAPAASAATAPTASAPRPTQVGGLDADSWRKILRQTPSTRDYSKGITAMLALADLDPGSLAGADVRAAAVDVAVNSGFDAARGGTVMTALAERFGSDGIDVLFDVVTTRGGSKGATTAGELLAKPEIRARGTKALRLAIDLREAACADKLALLERAREEGDERALGILLAARSPECAASAGACCLRDHAAVESVVRDLIERTRRR